jgi:hypothetical protein
MTLSCCDAVSSSFECDCSAHWISIDRFVVKKKGQMPNITTHEDQWIRLNVGGKVFHTRRSTLTTQPSLLRDMITSNFEGVPRDSDGVPHIDRDPSSFQNVLNFLRGYHLELTPEDTSILLEDASYFRCPALVTHLGADLSVAARFLPGPGVSADGKNFSSLSFVGHCGDFVSSGSHSVLFHMEKVLDGMGIGVVNAAGDTWDREVVGRGGSICYSQTGELMMHMDGALSLTAGLKWRDGDFIKIEIAFSSTTVTITFTKGSAVVHSVDVSPQPLRIVAWVQSQGGCMSIADTTSVLGTTEHRQHEYSRPPALDVLPTR